MKVFLFFIFLIPLVSTAQVKYNSESKKLYNKALKEYKAGKTVEALELFEACVAADSRYVEAYLNISNIKYASKDYASAVSNAQKAYSNNKFAPAVYAQLGKSFYMNGQADSSKLYLEKGLSMGNTSESDRFFLAKSYLQTEDYDKAISQLNEITKTSEKNAAIFNARGRANYLTGNYESAEADFKKALELEPNSTVAFSNLANAVLASGKTDDAIGYIEKGMVDAKDDDKVQMLILSGNYYHQKGEYENASKAFDDAIALDAKNVVVLNNQAALLLDQDQYESAISKCNEALDIQPEMMEAYFNRGIANEMLRKVEQACDDWEHAFILGSEKAEEYLNSATCNE
jgi:tetratricopeptide (TPR) repeat protein